MNKIFILLSFIIPIFLSSCGAKNSGGITALQEKIIDTTSGSCPYLTRDNNNHVVLSWIRKVDSSKAIVCYAVSTDEGSSFEKVIEIPGSTNVHPHGENMPKVIFKPSGEIIALWGASNPNPQNQYSGLVYYSQSFNQGTTWTKPRSLTTDTSSYDQRYFDVSLLPTGEAGIVWLDNRKQWNKEGSGLYYAVTKGKAGFEDERLISGPCCQCCRTDLYIDTKKNIHILYRAIINDSIRDMVHIVSTNDGKTFTHPKRISLDNWAISGCPHTGPAMAENKEGMHFTWFTGGNEAGIYYNHSKDNGKTFTARDSVSGKAAKHCQITTLPNHNILITWNESFPNGSSYSSRIGIEERGTDGSMISRQYITSDTSHSSFPVILPGNQNKVIVAYTEDVRNKEQIRYKQVILQ